MKHIIKTERGALVNIDQVQYLMVNEFFELQAVMPEARINIRKFPSREEALSWAENLVSERLMNR